MDPITLIQKYYPVDSLAYRVLIAHSQLVRNKALELADRASDLHPDRDFIAEAAFLHDIGIFYTYAPEIGCYGERHYLEHGYLGRELLEKEGFPRHALVCERHTGVGLTKEDIIRQGLPLPHRDMVPETLEEKIICFADCFYSKHPDKLHREKSLERVRKKIRRYGKDKEAVLEEWIRLFGLDHR